MALKNFRIHYKRHCSVASYDHYQDVKAVSEKMAIKKFWSHKDYRGHCNLDDMRYERDALGFKWDSVRAELISG